MVDRRYRDSAWGEPPAPQIAAQAPRPSEGGQTYTATRDDAPSGAERQIPCAALPPADRDQWGQPPAPVGTSPTAAGRNARGQFVSGSNGGPGRKRGSRNRLTDQFLTVIADDFAQHGSDALAKLREKDPAAYLQLIAGLVPRELITKHETEPDYSDMEWEEVIELIERAQQNEQVKIALEEVRKLGRLPHDKSQNPKD